MSYLESCSDFSNEVSDENENDWYEDEDEDEYPNCADCQNVYCCCEW